MQYWNDDQERICMRSRKQNVSGKNEDEPNSSVRSNSCHFRNINITSACFYYRSVPQLRPLPFCNLSLSTNRRGLIRGMQHFSLTIMPSLDRKMFSGSVDACFVLALSFQHGDLEPDCV